MRAIVTGGSRGIGRAVTLRLLERGARLALLGRDETALGALVAGAPGSAVLRCDLGQTTGLDAVVDDAVQRLGGLDVFVGCAGVVRYGNVGDVTREALREQLETNFVAPFLLAQRAALHLRARGGAIVNVASTLAMKPAAQTAAYAASKAALISMTRSFALELGRFGVRVNAVAPGVIDTDMIRVPRPALPRGDGVAPSVEQQLEALRALHPLGRLGTVEDVAGAVLHLLDAEFVTGTVLTVDGGLLLGA